MYQHADSKPVRVTLETAAGEPADPAAAIGSPDDAAWDGEAAEATVISLLKAIALNTTPDPAP